MSHVIVRVAKCIAQGPGAGVRGVCICSVVRPSCTAKPIDFGIVIGTGERRQGMIEKIEHGKAELHVVTLSNPEVLGQRQVRIPVHRSGQIRRPTRSRMACTGDGDAIRVDVTTIREALGGIASVSGIRGKIRSAEQLQGKSRRVV